MKLNNVRIIAAKGQNLMLYNAKNIDIEGFAGSSNEQAKISVSGKRTQNINIVKSAVGKDDVSIEQSVDVGQVKIN